MGNPTFPKGISPQQYLKKMIIKRVQLGALPFIFVFFACLTVGASAHAGQGLKILQDLEKDLVELADKVRPAVVNISPYAPNSTNKKSKGAFGRSRPTNAGAGVIIDGIKGLIVTNSHVVRDVEKVQVTLLEGGEFVAQVVATDEDTDLAILKIETETELASVAFGDSGKLKVGQFVIAVGNPYGLNDTLTLGIISGLNRENIHLSRYEDFIQTDASINPGNSGGPLLNISGEVIGINTAIINYAQSIGFAIPSNMVKRVVSQLIEKGEVQRGWLGVGIEPVTPEMAKTAKIKSGNGVIVNTVFEGDPADKAGLKVGDLILKIGGTPVHSPNSLIRMIGAISPGQTVYLNILRDGQSKMIPVKLQGQGKSRQRKLASADPFAFPSLGIHIEDNAPGGESGVTISKLLIDGAASRKGLQEGDQIIAINGQTLLTGRKHFERIVSSIPNGGPVFLLVLRNEEKVHFTLMREN